MQSFGDRLRWAMQQTDPPTSMRELARRVGLRWQSIQYLLDPGRNAKGSRHTEALARALGVSPTWLATGRGKPYQKGMPRFDQRAALRDAVQTAAVLLAQLERLADALDEPEKKGNGKA